jgi:hypothetical protein
MTIHPLARRVGGPLLGAAGGFGAYYWTACRGGG